MKKKLLLLPLLMALAISGCGNKPDKSEDIKSNEVINSSEIITSSENSSESSSSSSKSSTSVRPPVILGDAFEEAIKKDYKNMYVSFALNSMMNGQEYGYEYYLGGSDFVAVYDGTAAEGYGSSEYAWMFYSYYEGESYAYWDRGYVTEGWISKGSKGWPVGIDLAYFFMPYFLNNITKDDVDYVLGTYVVKDNKVDKVLEGLKFCWMTNDITYIDFRINEEGYISRIRGFDDPNDDEYGFQIELTNFGAQSAPTGVTLPPAISPNTIKTYAEMIGHEEEPDIYMTDINIVINDTVESDDTYGIIAYPDDVVDCSFTYLPTNANKIEINFISSNTDVVKVIHAPEAGHYYVRALAEGEADIYITHINGEKQTVTSNVVKVKVLPPKAVPISDQDVYRFLFTGYEGNNGNYSIGAANTIQGSQAPFDITSWRMEVRECTYSDIFNATDKVLYSACTSSNLFNTRFEDEVIFDFENQQVSQMSFAYALFRSNAYNSLNCLESFEIATSNEGESWTTIDVTDEVSQELNKATLSDGMSTKVLTKTFAPASMVKIVIKANKVGGNGGTDLAIGMKDFVFSKNSECHNFDDVEEFPVTSIVITAPRNRLKIGNSMRFNATVNPSNASNKSVRWISSNPEVISIDSRTGLATALAEGTAKIKAVSATNREMFSNELTIETYLQDDIYDPEGYLAGKTFFASGVTSGVNTFDVTFAVKSNTTAELTLSFEMMGMPFNNRVDLVFDNFEPVSRVYEFYSSNNDVAYLKVAEDGSYVEIKYKTNGSESFTLGSTSEYIRLEKVR